MTLICKATLQPPPPSSERRSPEAPARLNPACSVLLSGGWQSLFGSPLGGTFSIRIVPERTILWLRDGREPQPADWSLIKQRSSTNRTMRWNVVGSVYLGRRCRALGHFVPGHGGQVANAQGHLVVRVYPEGPQVAGQGQQVRDEARGYDVGEVLDCRVVFEAGEVGGRLRKKDLLRNNQDKRYDDNRSLCWIESWLPLELCEEVTQATAEWFQTVQCKCLPEGLFLKIKGAEGFFLMVRETVS